MPVTFQPDTATTIPLSNWQVPPVQAFADARWFPVDLHVPRREIGFLNLNEELINNSAFLDNRMAAPWQNPAWHTTNELPTSVATSAPALLLHTSFCCSTLLARLLQSTPQVISLREPLVLRRLADAQFAKFSFDELLPRCLDLLARPWHQNGAVLIKPTHVSLPLAHRITDHFSTSKAVILTSSLESFMLSNLKKSIDSQSKVPELIHRMCVGASFESELKQTDLSKLSFLQQVALQWMTQQALVATLLRRVGSERLRVVTEAALLAKMEETALSVAQWLRLPLDRASIQTNIRLEAGRHAKQTTTGYSVSRKQEEASYLRSLHGNEILSTLRWSNQVLARQFGPFLSELSKPDNHLIISGSGESRCYGFRLSHTELH